MTERHADLSFSQARMDIRAPFILENTGFDAGGTLIFLHPPKVAGTNLTFFMTAVASLYPDVHVKRFAVPRVAGQSPNLITTGWQGGLASAAHAPDETFDALNFISGHMPLGLHERLRKPFNYIAMVRDPVEREISALNFDYQRGYMDGKNIEGHLFDKVLDNPQTRMVAGADYTHGECTEETYEKARANLDSLFLFAAPHDAALEVAQTLAGIYNTNAFAIARAQVTGVKLIDNPPDYLAADLRTKHAFDVRMAEDVKTRWANWKEAHVTGVKPIEPNDKIICMPPEFATTKNPALMPLAEVERHNAKAGNGLVTVSQNHTELKPNL